MPEATIGKSFEIPQPLDRPRREEKEGHPEYYEDNRECSICRKKFTRSFPKAWFGPDGDLDQHSIVKAGVEYSVAKELLEDNVCGLCKRKSVKESPDQEKLANDKKKVA